MTVQEAGQHHLVVTYPDELGFGGGGEIVALRDWAIAGGGPR